MARPSRNDIRAAAQHFAHDWRDEVSERGEAQSFWTDFLLIFGVHRRRVRAAFERHARRTSTGGAGFIDLLWPGMLLAEHKSKGENLNEAMDQALDYIDSLPDADLPRLVVVSDFANIVVLDFDDPDRRRFAFSLDDLPREVDRFLSLAGYSTARYDTEDAVDIEAAELLGRVYDEVVDTGFPAEHALRVFIVRLLFMLFGDDTGLWPRNQFADLVANRTAEDGSDLGMWLGRLFAVADTPENERTAALDEDLAAFPYVNGGLFSERLETPDTTRSMRNRLLEACRFDWSKISPAVFGSMFQSIMLPAARREIGAHYTSERNILKVIEPLFLDELRAELDRAGTSRQRLRALHERLGSLTFFDPACGCGNFLVIAYRELRRLEKDLLLRLHPTVQSSMLLTDFRKVGVQQFHGIEVEEFPARIAETAMYLVDHLENESLGLAFGLNVVDLPLQATANVHVKNALRLDWSAVLPPADCTYLFGNPPFIGKKRRTDEQQADMEIVFGADSRAGVLDYVAAWYRKATAYMAGTSCRAAFVSTSSITQGEQVPVMWRDFHSQGFDIDFAHRTFNWTSEGRGAAHVHCVIIGFSQVQVRARRRLFDYPDINGDPIVRDAGNINPYLADAPTVLVLSRRTPVAALPSARFGSMPNDGGHLLLTADEAAEVRATDSTAAKYLRPLLSAREMLHGNERFCFWLAEADPADIRSSPVLRRRVEAVRAYRNASTRPATRRLAATPALFAEIRQPDSDYLCVPRHPSADRSVAPVLFASPEMIASDSTIAIPAADHYLFGLLQSAMFMAWLRAVGGRIKSDLRFSIEVVYNTFPAPDLSETRRSRVAEAAQQVLAARATHQSSSLADLYDRLAMPSNLAAAHAALDRAVESAFGRRAALTTDAERLAVLFPKYEQAAAPPRLPGVVPEDAPGTRRRRTAT